MLPRKRKPCPAPVRRAVGYVSGLATLKINPDSLLTEIKTKINSSPPCHKLSRHLALLRGTLGKKRALKKGTFLVKSFAAKFTHKRFVAGVYSCVRVQGRAPVKSLAALVALVWLFLKGNKCGDAARWLICGVSVPVRRARALADGSAAGPTRCRCEMPPGTPTLLAQTKSPATRLRRSPPRDAASEPMDNAGRPKSHERKRDGGSPECG